MVLEVFTGSGKRILTIEQLLAFPEPDQLMAQ